jgi:glyoxylase-like metal-dependent hydrolase (beta-lactamase superfamily II)
LKLAAVHGDVLVATSRLWQTNAVVVRSGGEAMLVDSPYFPDELELLPELMKQAGFDVSALLATHADFDHLLGRLAFPGLSLGVAESTMLRIRSGPGVAQRELRDADAELYVKRPAPLSLGQVQSLPVPGKLELGQEEFELHPADGHTQDGMAILAPAPQVLLCGDYLSNVEIPSLGEGGSLVDYRSTLARLGRLAEKAEIVVPGHGSPQDREAALGILEADLAYLDALERGDERPDLPEGRDSSRQREMHAENLRALT